MTGAELVDWYNWLVMRMNSSLENVLRFKKSVSDTYWIRYEYRKQIDGCEISDKWQIAKVGK
jgi:hypothetical protein